MSFVGGNRKRRGSKGRKKIKHSGAKGNAANVGDEEVAAAEQDGSAQPSASYSDNTLNAFQEAAVAALGLVSDPHVLHDVDNLCALLARQTGSESWTGE